MELSLSKMKIQLFIQQKRYLNFKKYLGNRYLILLEINISTHWK